MHKFIKFIKEFSIPKKKELLKAIDSLSKKEFLFFSILIIISIISILTILFKINNYFMVDVPQKGGSIREGIIGTSVLINPILSISDADKDLTSLIYSGLMRKNEKGELINDLAESYEVSPDGKTYRFFLKKDLEFHDGELFDADDVIFTIEKIKDPLIKSPRKAIWDNVEIQKENDFTIVFNLKEPHISFMENTTIGILPSHLWKNVNIQEFGVSRLNINPIGTGPYKIVKVEKDKDGIPQKYKLRNFRNFSLGIPNIKEIEILSFSNDKELIKALIDGDIDQAGGVSPENLEKIKNSNFNIKTGTLSRTFGLFFNTNNNKILEDSSVIKSIELALNKDFIVEEVLKGYGISILNPIPENILKINEEYKFSPTQIDEAISILEKSGWRKGDDGIMEKGGKITKIVTKTVKGKKVEESITVDEGPVIKLLFSLTTGDTPELKQTATIIKNQLEKIGIDVNTEKIYETGQLTQVIRNREYESLFFGQRVNYESDLYSMWHSSQRTDPGLNIAMNNNKNIDTILENIQATQNKDNREVKYKEMIEEFNKNPKFVMIYSPQYIYITSKKLNNIELYSLNNQSDRFNSVYKWYAKKDRVWKIFTN